MPLNHPQTIPPSPQFMEKFSSIKLVLGDKRIEDHCFKAWASLVAQMVKNLPAMQESWV